MMVYCHLVRVSHGRQIYQKVSVQSVVECAKLVDVPETEPTTVEEAEKEVEEAQRELDQSMADIAETTRELNRLAAELKNLMMNTWEMRLIMNY
jgi:peptidoglycan hydrolase CwlO-like protein